MQSKAKNVKRYLEELPPERKLAISKVRQVILRNLPKGYEETMLYGMIAYVVPLKTFPEGYLGQKDVPIGIAGLASQKNHMAVYLMNIYQKPTREWFLKEYKKSGKKLDIGKSCVRFTKLENLPLPLIGKAIAKTSVEQCIQAYREARKK